VIYVINLCQKEDFSAKFVTNWKRGSIVGEEKALQKTGKQEIKVPEKSKDQPDYGCVPSRFWYTCFGSHLVLNACRFIFGIKVRADRKIKSLPGPMVIVGNHPSFIDPIIMATALYGRPINFVAGEFLFRRKIFGPVIAKGGCIPKAQYRTDIRTVKAMMRVLSRGGVLGIFPEGTRLTDGHSIPFESGLASLVKKTGSSLVVFRSHGAYLTWPRWSENSWRKGRITAEFTSVLPKEEVEKMSIDEIYEFMKKELEYDEFQYFSDHPQNFRSKAIAAGVQNIANICPKCGGLNTTRVVDGKGDTSLRKDLRRKGNVLVCSKCGNKVAMNRRCFFEPAGPEDKYFPDLRQWAEWEQGIYGKMASEEGFCLKEKVELHKLCEEIYYAKVGEGVLTIRDGAITYEGTECAPEDGILYKKGKPVKSQKDRDLSLVAKPVTKVFPIHQIKGMLMDYGKYMEVFEAGGKGNRLIPENPQRLYEIHSIVQAMKKQDPS